MASRDPEIAPVDLPPTNITIIGAFNPDILVPAWVAKHLVLPSPVADTFIEASGRRVFFRSGELIWLPERTRLVVYGPPALTSSFVVSLARELPHTPFTAVGFNMQTVCGFDLSSCREWQIQLDRAAITSLLRGETTEFSFSHTVGRADAVGLTLKARLPGGGPEVILDFNYHLQVSSLAPDDNRQRAELVASHAARAEEFERDARRIQEALIR